MQPDKPASGTLPEKAADKFATTNTTNEIVRAFNASQAHGLHSEDRRQRWDDDGVWLVWDSGPNGEDDYGDPRYWLRRAYLSNDDGADAMDATELTELDVSHSSDAETKTVWITATNVSEIPTGGHSLTKGTPIMVVRLEEDSASPQVSRWVFQSGGSESTAPQYTGMVNIGVGANTAGWAFLFTVASLPGVS